MLHRITLLAIAAPRRLLGVAALVMVAAAVFGVPVAKSLSAGGFQDPSAESSRAMRLLTDKFGQGDVQLMFLVTAPGGAGGSSARAAGREIVDLLHNAPYVVDVVSAWTGLRRRLPTWSARTAGPDWLSRGYPAARCWPLSAGSIWPTRCRSRCCPATVT